MNKSTEHELHRKISAAENLAVRQRNYRRARDRALAKLSSIYKEKYLELLALEKEKDEQEGKRWSYAAGDNADLWTNITEYISKAGRNPSVNPQDEGNEK